MSKGYLTRRKLCERYDISAMTLWRWEHDEKMGLPAPMLVGRRKLYAIEDIELWERSRVAPPASAASVNAA